MDSVKKLAFIAGGILLAKFGLESFLIPNHMIDGGITGLSLLMTQLTSYPLWVFLVCLNVPFVVWSAKHVSLKFAMRATATLLLFAIALRFPYFPSLTDDLFLAAIFGGLSLGAGIAFSIRGSTVIDGTEILALILSNRTHFSIGAVIFGFNVILFSGALLVIDVELVMYAVITYFTASKTTDFFLYGIEEKIAVMIISDKHQLIRNSLVSDLGMGVTVFYGASGYHQTQKEVLMCITSAYEIPRLKRIVRDMDEAAFLVMYRVTNTVGGHLKESQIMMA